MSAQAGDGLGHLEGLGEIVVGAGLDAVDALHPAAARRKDEHGRQLAGGAPAFQYGEPIEAGEKRNRAAAQGTRCGQYAGILEGGHVEAPCPATERRR